MHPTSIDLPLQTREAMTRLLNARLADAIDLSLQAKQAHWNVKGPQFIALHELFDKLHTEAEAYIDELAERVTALGGTAIGTSGAVAESSTLPGYPLDITDGFDHVRALSASYAAFGKNVRAGIGQADDAGDDDTADIFTGISKSVDKQLWFLEAHLHGTQGR